MPMPSTLEETPAEVILRQFRRLEDTNSDIRQTLSHLKQFGLSQTLELMELCNVLAARNERQTKRIIELESIAPKKITVGGKQFIWHCPDELIPDTTPKK